MAAKERVFKEAGQQIVLRSLGTHYELMLGQVPILSSKALATERGFGELVGSLELGPSPHVLIGGLGFGATLSGALARLGKDARVTVVEKLATVVNLMRGELAHLAPGALDDPRVNLLREDVADVIDRERDLSAILLDVDNGPGWASFQSNARLYGPPGLRRARAALRVGGTYAVWSGYPADAFLVALKRAGVLPRALPMRERGVVRARVYLGKKAAPVPF